MNINQSTTGILKDVVIEIKEAIRKVERAHEKETKTFNALIATMEEFVREHQAFIKRLEALK